MYIHKKHFIIYPILFSYIFRSTFFSKQTLTMQMYGNSGSTNKAQTGRNVKYLIALLMLSHITEIATVLNKTIRFGGYIRDC